MSILLLYGESSPEPYCIDMRKNTALKDVDKKGLNYDSLKGKFTEEIINLARTYPMLEDKRGIVLEVDTLKDLDTKLFYDFAQKPPAFTEFIIICRNADKRLKAYKKLCVQGVKGVTAVLCDKKEVTKDKLVKTIAYELKLGGASMATDALWEFLSRINYEENRDMNLLTATGYLKTLMAVNKTIDKAMVEKFVPAFKEADAFLLVNLLINKDIRGLQEQVNMASPKDAVGILCLILRSFRIAWKQKYFKDVSAGGNEALQKYDAETLKKCIGIINKNISGIKTGYMSQDLALKVACGELAACM